MKKKNFKKKSFAPSETPRAFGLASKSGRAAHRGRRLRDFETKTEDKNASSPSKEQPQKQKEPRLSVVGVVVKKSYGYALRPTDRRDKGDYTIKPPASAAQKVGNLVVASVVSGSPWGRQDVKITHDLGGPDDPRNYSLIAIHTHGIPDSFSEETLAESHAAQPVHLGSRTDLRAIPLVTIDGEDSRDFDDAVFAEKDGNGWHILVAIADVAHYVRHGSDLDRTGFLRGNSTYFTDRVVPMLPEKLSNDLCSLRPHEDRACFAVHIWIDEAGEITRWHFVRGLMRSAARLTYTQVQRAKDGNPDATTNPLLDRVILPLYGAFECLLKARGKRGTLELDLPERKVILDDKGHVAAIRQRESLDSHKLIEEFMIAANVCAAAQLENKGGVCLYRVHDMPNEMKLDALRAFLETLGISLSPAKQMHPRLLTQILKKAEGTPHAQVVNEIMLRTQSQAVYSHENIGHFGLALARYAHFTSPIRRYADLVVHRALIRVCNLGEDGISETEIKNLSDIGAHISSTERRSATAERDVTDRYTAHFLANKIGAVFQARISGVGKFGLFARLNETGADGIVPFANLPRDYYVYHEKTQSLIGERNGHSFQLAQPVTVRLEKADKLTGGLAFSIIQNEGKSKFEKRYAAKVSETKAGDDDRISTDVRTPKRDRYHDRKNKHPNTKKHPNNEKDASPKFFEKKDKNDKNNTNDKREKTETIKNIKTIKNGGDVKKPPPHKYGEKRRKDFGTNSENPAFENSKKFEDRKSEHPKFEKKTKKYAPPKTDEKPFSKAQEKNKQITKRKKTNDHDQKRRKKD